METIDPEAVQEEIRLWVYGHLADLFTEVPEKLDPPAALDPGAGPNAATGAGRGPGSAAGRRAPYPRTRQAIADLVRDFAGRSRRDVEAEQVRLFVNAVDGVPAPPYASFYLDKTLMGPACDAAAEAYREQNLGIVSGAGEPADFIGVELEFLYYLWRHGRAARLTGDRAGYATIRAAADRFLLDHLVRWVPAFAERIRSAEPQGLYTRAADVLERFFLEERERLGPRAGRTDPAIRR